MKVTRSQRASLGQWSPLDQLSRLRQEINRFFEMPMSSGGASQMFEGWTPAIDLFEDKESITVKAEMPGMKKEDIDLSVEGNTLSISGERREEKQTGQGASFRSERYFGKFYRSVTLPTAVDANRVVAKYKDGILTLTLPKTEEARRKQIPVVSDNEGETA